MAIRIRIRTNRIRIDFFVFSKIRIRRIEYSNTPALDTDNTGERSERGQRVDATGSDVEPRFMTYEILGSRSQLCSSPALQ
jgi:hypothetical protein